MFKIFGRNSIALNSSTISYLSRARFASNAQACSSGRMRGLSSNFMCNSLRNYSNGTDETIKANTIDEINDVDPLKTAAKDQMDAYKMDGKTYLDNLDPFWNGIVSLAKSGQRE